ncbi:DNA-formamidopyrimidine glycosylase, partial [Neisseria gonorrhoeae]
MRIKGRPSFRRHLSEEMSGGVMPELPEVETTLRGIAP